MLQPSQRIVEAACALFAEHGYRATSTKQIAKRAGVNESTIFRQFGGKKKLLDVCISSILEVDASPAAVKQIMQIEGFEDAFREYTRLNARLMTPRYVRLLLVYLFELPPSAGQRWLMGVAPKWHGPIFRRLNREIKAGRIQAPSAEFAFRALSYPIFAQAIVSAMFGKDFGQLMKLNAKDADRYFELWLRAVSPINASGRLQPRK